MLKQMRLDGKVALVTGASRGIGRSAAECLAEAGADLVLVARSKGGLEETAQLVRAQGRQALTVGADVTNRAEIDQCIEEALAKFGHIDILVNNAGGQLVKPFLEYTPAEWNDLIDTNLGSVLHVTQAVGRHMVERKSGSIVMTGSVYGFIGAPGNAIYALTKAGMGQFARTLSVEWARYNIRVNVVAPGWVQTALIEDYIQDEKVVAAAVKQIPLRRLGLPEDIGPAVVYLASDAASYITGQYLVIDGGQSSR